jgi:hypothetical protein
MPPQAYDLGELQFSCSQYRALVSLPALATARFADVVFDMVEDLQITQHRILVLPPGLGKSRRDDILLTCHLL